MSLGEFSDIAEIIAATATIVALIYLAIQVKSATAAMKADSRRAEQYLPYATSIVENPDVARIFMAGLGEDPKLSPEDSVRFDFLFGQYLGIEAAYFDEVKFGVGSEKILGIRRVQLVRFLSTPGGKRHLKLYRGAYSDEFLAYIEKSIEEANAP